MNGKSILMIEDAPDIQLLLGRLLKSEGYTVECADNGRKGLEKLRAASSLPDLILLDLMMPEMDGYEFRREQEKDASLASIPVLVMTADGDYQAKAMRIGAKGYLRKPFQDIDLILETIAKVMANGT